MPLISVVTSVYNGEAYLKECVDSVLNQTFQDFEYIILNNGSTDGTAEILSQYTEPRLQIVHQENQGLSRSLNKGIHMASSELIARLDADDFSNPYRLEKQINFMNQHPEIVLCGSQFKVLLGMDYIDNPTHGLEDDESIRKSMSCFNPFAHSTVVFRKAAFIKSGGYREKFKFGQDYDLWSRILDFGEAYILRNELSTIRLHELSTSSKNSKAIRIEGLQIRWNAFKKFGGNPGEALFHFLKSMIGLYTPPKSPFKK
ncbi:MAG: hypothetical protein CL402_00305 [Acidiferrobacteraceae bacterium]|nr:hypothetical protein [Acidiferrobacteraceae bacterium]|tara:strand:- start:7709 stop:8482 length:774 start_codon:yes stop_codon:yes gene_type:complete